MGKPKGRNPKLAKFAKRKGLSSVQEGKESKYSIDEILDKAEDFMNQYNYEIGEKFCQRALEMNPDHARALQLSATLLIERGDLENAKHCLGRAITVQPDQGHDKYMSLAQLFTGKDSLQLYNKGVEILNIAMEQESDEDKKKELSREISTAYCAVAELFMTDLCDEPEAEQQCEKSVKEALEKDSASAEAWQTKARLALIRKNFEEAKSSIKRSLEQWMPSYQAVLENKQEAGQFDPVEVCPLLYTTRITSAKILIELELFDEATQVLEGLLEEDNEVVDTWYLLGWLSRLRAMAPNGEDGYNGNAIFYLKKAKETHKKSPTDDIGMINHIDEVIAEIGKVDEEENGEDQEEWEDVESSADDDEAMEQS